jgi:hypothetical protein
VCEPGEHGQLQRPEHDGGREDDRDGIAAIGMPGLSGDDPESDEPGAHGAASQGSERPRPHRRLPGPGSPGRKDQAAELSALCRSAIDDSFFAVTGHAPLRVTRPAGYMTMAFHAVPTRSVRRPRVRAARPGDGRSCMRGCWHAGGGDHHGYYAVMSVPVGLGDPRLLASPPAAGEPWTDRTRVGHDVRVVPAGGGKVAADAVVPAVRTVVPLMRVALLLGAFLVTLAGIQLYVLSGHTDRYFAWTIAVSLTAAFLGAFYWASVPLALLAGLRGVWVDARPGVLRIIPGVNGGRNLAEVALWLTRL